MNINKNKLLENIKDIKNIANLNFLVCYKNLFKIVALKYNIGSYIILSIILFHIISIFVVCIKDFNLIKKKIKKILFEMNNDKKEKSIKDKSKDMLNEISVYRKEKKVRVRVINFKLSRKSR